MRQLVAAAALVVVALRATPVAAQATHVLDEQASSVAFRGTLATHEIAGFSEDVRGVLRIDGASLRSIRGAVHVPIASLRTTPFFASRQVKALLGAPDHPEIVFSLDSAVIERGLWIYHGQLSMHGCKRPVRFVGQAATGDTSLVAEGRANVDVRHWGIVPPRWLKGAVRMNPMIALSFRATFRPVGGADHDLVIREASYRPTDAALPNRSNAPR